jgi:hypothetical protein
MNTCKHCDGPLPPRKRGRRQEYCTDKCRKAASRVVEQEASDEEMEAIRMLRLLSYVGQLWPVYTWDDSPRIMALILPRHIALQDVNGYMKEPISEAQFSKLLGTCGIVDYHDCGRVLQQAIKDFYTARKDRRIRRWRDTHTPSDKALVPA